MDDALDAANKKQRDAYIKVLILLLMDDALDADGEPRLYLAMPSLNPSFNG